MGDGERVIDVVDEGVLVRSWVGLGDPTGDEVTELVTICVPLRTCVRVLVGVRVSLANWLVVPDIIWEGVTACDAD